MRISKDILNLAIRATTFEIDFNMEIFSVGKFSFSSFLSIQTLIKCSYFVDDPLVEVFHFCHFPA